MVQETALNTKLGELLAQHGLQAAGQSKQKSGKEWDVEVWGQSWTAACEAKKSQTTSTKRAAKADARGRIDQGRANFAVAVCYPEGVTLNRLEQVTDLMWAVYTSLDEAGGWRTGSVRDLANTIKRVGSQQLGNPDLIARYLTDTFDDAIRTFDRTQLAMLCKSVDLPTDKKDKGRNGAIRVMLILAAAVMFHSRLDRYLPGMRPSEDHRGADNIPFAGDWPPKGAQRCSLDDNPVGAFIEAWDLILALDYRPIFETAREVLIECHAIGPIFTTAVKLVAEAALATTANVAGLRHDLLGRIFHRVLDTSRYDGSFYTSTAAATLLAHIAIPDNFCNWSDPEAAAGLRIVDPACGTGTLLMAAAERIRDLSPKHNHERLSKALIEHVLYGLDINLTATHMAATTLGLLSPTTDFRDMQIARASFGVEENGLARIGSLEFLGGRFKTEAWPGRQIETDEEIERPISDLVIMNPPYTRDSLRYDQLSKGDEQAMKGRERMLLQNTEAHRSGSVGGFTVLGEHLTKDRDGCTLAMVLPLTMATDYAGHKCRIMLAERFHIDTIICSHDPSRIYFSENTSIGEILLVCRRAGAGELRPTRVVKLARNPATPADADFLAQRIASRDMSGWGIIQYWPSELIQGGDWGAVQFLSTHLGDTFVELKLGKLLPIRELESLAYIGPEGRRTRAEFYSTDMPAGPMRALWRNDTSVTQTMAADTDCYIVPKEGGKEHLAAKYWGQRSRLLLPADPRLDTARTLAVCLPHPALGSRWIPVRPHEDAEVMEKALCTWFNSSLGILAMLGGRTSKVPSRPRLSISDMRRIPVPRLDETAARALASVFDRLGRLPLGNVQDLETDWVRLQIDQTVTSELRIDPELVTSIRRDLTREPSITNRRYEP